MRDKTNLSDDDFDAADEYLLKARMCEGTMGGDAGQRWLTPSGVSFVRTQLDQRDGASGISDRRQQGSIDVFVSHSSKDAAIAKALVLLLRAALNIPADRIRCTSVDGYRLPVGALTDDQLRVELRESRVFLGLITKSSIESTYVLFELGARWGADLQLAPVLVSSSEKGLLQGPLSGRNALACDSRSQILQLVDDVASDLAMPVARAASYEEHVEAVLLSCGSSEAHQHKNVSSVEGETDFERMAKHVDNYFAEKPFKRVGFESIRKYINSAYSDQMLFEMIDKFPERFRRVTLRGNKPAVGRVVALIQSQAT